MNEKQKSGLILGLIGVALAVVAIRPPKLLVRLYLAFEQVVAVLLGVLLAVAGIATLLEKAPARVAAEPDYTIEYDDCHVETNE